MASLSVLNILRTIKEKGSVSRTDLQQITGLSWGTITNTTRELLARNLIREEGALSTRAGRKPMRLALNPGGHSLVGAEIAPDGLKCLVMNLAGETLSYEEAGASPGEPSAAVLERLTGMIQRGLAAGQSRTCMGIGIAVPGALDAETGIVRYAPRLPGWKDVPVREHVQVRVGAPVKVEHNPNCLALAERWFGEAGGAEHVLCLHLGEGVGMGILIDGEIFRGSDSMAGEFGHMTVDPDGPACACGDKGCVEAYCSASAIISHAQGVGVAGSAASKVRTVEELSALADSGDAGAREIFERMGRYLGIGIANLIDLFNPTVVVVAGRTMLARAHFLDAATREMDRRAWRESRRKLLISALGERATVMGACGMILQSGIAHVERAGAIPA